MKKIFNKIMGVFGLLMILIQTYAVFSRNLLNTAAPWSDEILRLLLIWSIFICSAEAFLNDELIGLDILETKFSINKRIFNFIKIIQYLVGLLFSVICLARSFEIVKHQFYTMETTTAMKIPLGIINLGFLIGATLFLVFSIYKLKETIKKV